MKSVIFTRNYMGEGDYYADRNIVAELGNKVQCMTSYGILTKSAARSLAFTLAEVLITLGIIGVVAAITLPTVINNIQDKQFKTAFKKQFSIISQALHMIYIDDGEEIEFEDWREMPNYVCKIGKKLKAAQYGLKCDEIAAMAPDDDFEYHTNKKVSWHANESWYDAQKRPMHSNSGYWNMIFYLPDGAWINFNCRRYVFIDVNGAKKPNTIGRDIFYFILPQKSISPNFFDTNGNINVNGCTAPNYNTQFTRKNYEEDCKNGSGWGCSPLYILD